MRQVSFSAGIRLIGKVYHLKVQLFLKACGLRSHDFSSLWLLKKSDLRSDRLCQVGRISFARRLYLWYMHVRQTALWPTQLRNSDDFSAQKSLFPFSSHDRGRWWWGRSHATKCARPCDSDAVNWSLTASCRCIHLAISCLHFEIYNDPSFLTSLSISCLSFNRSRETKSRRH